jgi:putative hydrolase of the HAD superfamily
MLNTLIFDFGGVLGSDSDTIFIDVLKKNKIQNETALKIWLDFWPNLKTGEISVDFIWEEVKKHTSADIKKLVREYNKAIFVDPKMLDFCRNLKKYKLGILANESYEWMNVKRKKGKLDEIFNVVYSSADIQVAKPEHEAFIKTLNALEAKPQETLFVDNLERNTKAAEELGMKTVLFENSDKLIKTLNKLINLNITI